MRFVLPHHRGLRPAFLIRPRSLSLRSPGRGRRILEPSRTVDLSRLAAGRPLKPTFTRAFEYSDCWVDDARLVVLNAMDAAARGAEIRVRTQVVSVHRTASHWRIEMENLVSGQHENGDRARPHQRHRCVGGHGPADGIAPGRRPGIRLVKGSHIVVRRLFEHDRAYIFQNADRRIIFAIPYEGNSRSSAPPTWILRMTLPASRFRRKRREYLCRAVSEYFAAPVSPSDIVWSYAGVRSLFDDRELSAQDATRDFVLDLDGPKGRPWLLTIVGGKITAYRRSAEEVWASLRRCFRARGLPGRARSAAWRRFCPRGTGAAGIRLGRSGSRASAGNLASSGRAPTAPSRARFCGSAGCCFRTRLGSASISVPGCMSARLPISSKTNGR